MIGLSQVAVYAGSFHLKDITLDVPEGDYAVLMGKTGSGKTTLLEAICGLRPVVRGCVRLAGRDVTRMKPAQRGVGYVPQDGALFASMTVKEHLAFALQIRKHPAAGITERVRELASMLGLEPLLKRRVRGLSGGEAQRVALGRALSFHPKILCLDEPLSALDDDTRTEMYGVLRVVRQRTAVTVLHVTHNRVEAEHLADRGYLLERGQIRRM